MRQKRAQFATRLGVIATTVGSAVGLGNIWRFPYEAGMHGGGAFLIFYIGFIAILGIPVICAEFVMGRASRRNIFDAFRMLGGGRYWPLTGYIGIVASIFILSFYSVVAGWTVEYFVQSARGALAAMTEAERHASFDTFASGWRSVIWTIVFLAINAAIAIRGVRSGIERASNVLMPLLFVILVVFCINSLLLPQAAEGLRFLFSPDFSKISPQMLIGAMGQAFFSLSIGLGTMMIYASYFSDSTPLVKSATTTALLDTLVAVLAGVIIFPAVFTFGSQPTAGPKLVFEVLPAIFHQMPGGVLWSTGFFLLLMLASLTSTISMSETCVAFCCEKFGLSRRKSVIACTAVAMTLGAVCALSFGPLSDVRIFGLTAFGLFDYTSSNILLPLGGMLISIFVGWRLDRGILLQQLSTGSRLHPLLLRALVVCLRYVAPTCIGIVFLAGIGAI